jgi:hypothetical protein
MMFRFGAPFNEPHTSKIKKNTKEKKKKEKRGGKREE